MLEQLKKKKFIRAFGVGLSGNVITLAFLILNSILTARLLGPENRGMYTLLFSTMMISIATISIKLGYSQAYLRKKYTLDEIISNSVPLTLFSSLISILITGAVVAHFYNQMFQGVPRELIIIILCAIPVFQIMANMKTALIADYDITRATLVGISRPAIFFAAFSVAGLSGVATLETAIKCVFISIFGAAFLSVLMVFKRGFRVFKLNAQILKTMTSFALKTHIGQMFKYLQYRFDIFLVAYFLSPKEVGIYSIAMVISEILWRIPDVAQTVLLPKLVKEGNRRSAELTARMNRIIFAFTGMCLIPMAVGIDWIILLMYGSEYQDAGRVVLVLLPGALAISVFKLLTPNLITRGRAWTYSLSVFCAVLVMVTLDVIMIPRYGIIGAGIAASIAYITCSLIVLFAVVRINDLPLRSYFDVVPEIKLLFKARAI